VRPHAKCALDHIAFQFHFYYSISPEGAISDFFAGIHWRQCAREPERRNRAELGGLLEDLSAIDARANEPKPTQPSRMRRGGRVSQ
jgi:hypothetical protein